MMGAANLGGERRTRDLWRAEFCGPRFIAGRTANRIPLPESGKSGRKLIPATKLCDSNHKTSAGKSDTLPVAIPQR